MPYLFDFYAFSVTYRVNFGRLQARKQMNYRPLALDPPSHPHSTFRLLMAK
jgi:hypothetical protein